MSEISAQTAKAILLGLDIPGAVLLRGVDSILRGQTQNDIDVFIPQSAWDQGRVRRFGKIICTKRTGLPQFTVSLLVYETGETAKIDIFHAVTWRGVELIRVSALPVRWVPELEILCLTRDAEAWLTVLKNTLHNSLTPPTKLRGVTGDPVFSMSRSRAGAVASALERCVARNVWAVARGGIQVRRGAGRARLCIILLRVIENPLGTLTGFARWLVWRLFR